MHTNEEMTHVQKCDGVNCGGLGRMKTALSSHKEMVIKKIVGFVFSQSDLSSHKVMVVKNI